jgi:hypothetical protein
MCYVCLGDQIDPSTGETCPRCKGTGRDPDPDIGMATDNDIIDAGAVA